MVDELVHHHPPQTSDCLRKSFGRNPLKYHQLDLFRQSIEVGHNNSMRHNLVWLMATKAAANLYYNQPLLAAIAQTFMLPPRSRFIPILTQIGYAVGFSLFLGDLMERRRLIITMLLATALALGGAAVSPNITWLVGASLVIGMTTIAAQLIVPFAAQLAKPKERGKVVGMVMSGLLIGILLLGRLADLWEQV